MFIWWWWVWCFNLLSGKDYVRGIPLTVETLCLQGRLKILQTVNQARDTSAFNRRCHFCLYYFFIFNLPPLLARLTSRVCQIQAIFLRHKAMKFVECGWTRISTSSGKSQIEWLWESSRMYPWATAGFCAPSSKNLPISISIEKLSVIVLCFRETGFLRTIIKTR